jgi:hypothetical protein
MSKKIFLIFIFFGLILRLLFSAFSFHTGDLASWMYLGDSIFKYNISPFVWWSQGPLNLIPIVGFQFLHYLMPNNNYFSSICYHLSFILGDFLIILLIEKILNNYYKEKGDHYLPVLVIWFNIIFIFLSSIKGQTEQWMVLFTLLGIYLTSKNKIFTGFLFLGCGFAVKYIPILLMPFLLLIINPKKYFKNIFAFILPFILGFIFFYFINLIIYNDKNLIRYILDRTGTIFGSFTPDFAGQIFVGTGMSIWGQLSQIKIVSKETLVQLKKYWLHIYIVYYCLLFCFFYLLKLKLKLINLGDRKVFILINIIYADLLLPFLWLYPQMTDHRLLNLVFPLYFLFIFAKLNLNILNSIILFFIFAADIYSKGGYFLIKANTYIYSIIWVLLSITMYIFSIKNKDDLLLAFTSITVFSALFITGKPHYHQWMMLLSYIYLIIITIVLNIKIINQLKIPNE